MNMNKLDRIKNVLDCEVLEYLDSESPNTDFIEVETDICFEDEVEYEATVRINAEYRLNRDYITDEYGNRHDESTYELRNYQYDIIDLYDFGKECFIIKDGKKV